MKKAILFFLIFSSPLLFGQLKADLDKPLDIKSGVIKKAGESNIELPAQENKSFLGLINPANLTMRHSFGLSYSSFGGAGYMTTGVYTNSLMYKFNDDLNFQMEASLVNSPSNSFGTDFTKNFNGIYITRAALSYKLSDNAQIHVEYRMLPMGMGYNPYGYSPFGYRGGFGSFGGFGRFGFADDYFWDE